MLEVKKNLSVYLVKNTDKQYSFRSQRQLEKLDIEI